MTTRISDRRGGARYTVHVPIHVSQVGMGSTVDISATGVAFLIDRMLEPGVAIRFELALDDGNALLACDGRVVRVERRERNVFTAATIETLDVKPATEH
jgi:hypothetical protein